MDMAALHRDSVGLQHLREPRQAINRDCCEDNAFSQKLLQESVEDLWRFFAGTQSALQKSGACVPHQMLAVLLAADVQCFAVENENAVWNMRIHKNSTLKITMQGAHHRRVLQDLLCVFYAAICTPVEHVAIMERRTFFLPSFLHPE